VIFDEEDVLSFPGGLNDLNIVLFSGLGVRDFLGCEMLVTGVSVDRVGSLCGTVFDRMVMSLPPLLILEGNAGRDGKGGRARSE
jgi:hypothetical protein